MLSVEGIASSYSSFTCAPKFTIGIHLLRISGCRLLSMISSLYFPFLNKNIMRQVLSLYRNSFVISKLQSYGIATLLTLYRL